jgi:cytidylate kinase
MADNILSSYLSGSFNKGNLPKTKTGLVVTISREKGAGALPIAKMILEKLHQLRYPLGKVVKWKLISKEILEQSAHKLKLAPTKVDSMLERQSKNLFDELLLTFSEKGLPNDIKIKNTIRSVIENAADEGNVIIIGRGGACITRNRENSLHVRLVAPLEWRVKRIVNVENMSIQEAEQLIKARDQQRIALKKFYLGDKKIDQLYDIVINVSTMKDSEIAEAIFGVIKQRQDALMHRH